MGSPNNITSTSRIDHKKPLEARDVLHAIITAVAMNTIIFGMTIGADALGIPAPVGTLTAGILLYALMKDRPSKIELLTQEGSVPVPDPDPDPDSYNWD